MQIEGVVTGEPDDGVVQSEGGQIRNDDDDDDETDENDDVWSSINLLLLLDLLM